MESYTTAREVWVGALILFRVASMVMLIPGLGDAYVPARVRLSFALMMALCIGPVVAPTLPPIPDGVGAMAGAVIKEVLIGLMIGGLIQMMASALTTAGEVISIQTTLSFAQTTNPTEAQSSTTVSTMLSLVGLTVIFTTDLHQMFLAAIVHSYTLFAPARTVPIHDAAMLAAQTIGKCFALGIQLAAPVLVFSLVFNIATGLVGRAMPQFQVFFVATPLALLLGLSLFALSIGTMGMVWVQHYEAYLRVFV